MSEKGNLTGNAGEGNLTGNAGKGNIVSNETSGAGTGTPEDTPNTLEDLVKSQTETISLLIEQNKSLQNQLRETVRSQGTIIDGANETTGVFENVPPASQLPENYVSLKDLGKEFGKKGK